MYLSHLPTLGYWDKYAVHQKRINASCLSGFLTNLEGGRKLNKPKKPTIEVKPHSYQPSKAELEADMSIKTTPNDLARSVLEHVEVKETEDT